MLTLRSIIGNIKKGQSALSVRHILEKLELTYQRIRDTIEITSATEQGKKVTIYLQCPSETEKRVNYDIVFELQTGRILNLDTKFKAYSNSPSFGYNFAYIFKLHGSLLWPEKYPSIILRESPKVRNPFNFVGFDKHIYSCIKYIADYNVSNAISRHSTTMVSVKTFEQKQREIKDLHEELRRSRTN